ncbi:AraC family transcriptional regulator [Arcicella aquatica]|uniref:AraC family transcriptional regulator n=1 Tax=Arcicella aquatica TaxID=217141 RepID=A0ABU5QL69_9BACT|nr:AraC family transcriptional regulator [Arcicella aquatica]MEA5257793.1 AraC family transcriptional regulator [Arcicella aquatica]
MLRKSLKNTFSLLNADYVQLNKNWNFKHVISPFYRMYLIDEGQGILFNAHESQTLEPNYLYLIPSFTVCNYQCDRFLSQYYIQFIEESIDGNALFSNHQKIIKVPAQTIDVEHFKRILALNKGRGLTQSNDPRDYEKHPILQSFKQMNEALDASALMETQGIIMQLLSRFMTKEYFDIEEKNVIPSKILESINYIQTHLDNSLTVEHLADRANLSPDYFSRIFNENTGERPLSYIQYKRIERAQLLMITTELSMNDIAIKTGFESLSYFSRIFKQVIQQTPSEYKKNNRVIY